MRIISKTNVQIYDDVDKKDCLYAPDDKLSEVTIDNFQRMVSGRFEIATSGSESLSFGDVTVVNGFLIQLIADTGAALPLATLDVNAVGTIPIGEPAQGKGAFMRMDGGPFTSLSIANLSATVVLKGRYAVWGDST